MTNPDLSPRAQTARRARQAADRARAHRARTRQVLAVDGAIVDSLAAAFARVKPGTTIEVFIRDVTGEALQRLQEAGVDGPGKVFRERVSLAVRVKRPFNCG